MLRHLFVRDDIVKKNACDIDIPDFWSWVLQDVHVILVFLSCLEFFLLFGLDFFEIVPLV